MGQSPFELHFKRFCSKFPFQKPSHFCWTYNLPPSVMPTKKVWNLTHPQIPPLSPSTKTHIIQHWKKNWKKHGEKKSASLPILTMPSPSCPRWALFLGISRAALPAGDGDLRAPRGNLRGGGSQAGDGRAAECGELQDVGAVADQLPGRGLSLSVGLCWFIKPMNTMNHTSPNYIRYLVWSIVKLVINQLS